RGKKIMRFLIIAAGSLALAACGDNGEEPVSEETVAGYPGVPEEQAAQVRKVGRVIDPASFDIFAPLVDSPPYDDVTMVEDVAYGGDPKQRLDVYTHNDAAEESRPVLLYVH